MTYETYESLMRILEKRIQRTRTTGSASDLHQVCMEKQRLMAEFQKEHGNDNKLQ